MNIQELEDDATSRFFALIEQWSGEEDTDGHAVEWCRDRVLEMMQEDLGLSEDTRFHLEVFLSSLE